jgi:large subunit ribosomal protein L28
VDLSALFSVGFINISAPKTHFDSITEARIIMSRICDITGKRRQKGMQVSHAMNHSRKFFQINLHKKRFWIPSEGRWVTLRVSSAGIRYIAKNGIEAALKKMGEDGLAK